MTYRRAVPVVRGRDVLHGGLKYIRQIVLLILFSMLVSALVLSGCGIPRIPNISAPDPAAVGTVDNERFWFEHNVANDVDEFLGYEVYYKIFDFADEEQEDKLKRERDQLEETAAGVAALENRAYRRLLNRDHLDGRPPLIPLAADRRGESGIRFTIDMADLENPDLSWDEQSVTVARNLDEEPEEPDRLSFDPDFIEAGDHDVDEDVGEEEEVRSWWVAMYVLAYGTDVEEPVPVHSPNVTFFLEMELF